LIHRPHTNRATAVFKKILIANRGEIALRIIRTCREMGIQTVAVYSTADRDSLHVRFADEAVCIGPPPSRDSYLRVPSIISAAEITGVDAIHPGYGFLSENAQFSQICADYGIKFIGPSPEVIHSMGDKATARDTMQRAGVPIVPGSDGVITNMNDARRWGREIGYPVMIKATAGGGGRGMRIVRSESELDNLWAQAQAEAGAAFGNDGLYMEKFVERPRHVEIQIVGDQYGRVSHLSERDCSIQRRNQKLVEEAPSPALDHRLREQMGDAAVAGAKSVGYEGLGTVEFLLDKNGQFYFMEMNTRIQVEHPVTEELFTLDLVREQIKIAAGEQISGKNYFPPNRHVMEVRINAEDPKNGFRPSPGRIGSFYRPGGQGVRIDTHVHAGAVIPSHYDSMLGKCIVVDENREACINRMQRALDEFVVEGIYTTIPFLQKLMQDPGFRAGDVHTRYLDDFVF
jgi:acetyl-CoA carboxylase biotin carboxylase subunit